MNTNVISFRKSLKDFITDEISKGTVDATFGRDDWRTVLKRPKSKGKNERDRFTTLYRHAKGLAEAAGRELPDIHDFVAAVKNFKEAVPSQNNRAGLEDLIDDLIVDGVFLNEVDARAWIRSRGAGRAANQWASGDFTAEEMVQKIRKSLAQKEKMAETTALKAIPLF